MSDKRLDLSWGSVTSDELTFPLWYYGIVVSNDDPFNAGRIKVRIDGVDKDITEADQLNNPMQGGLPWCQPLIPKYINIVPKVGELVKVAVFDYRNKAIRREYIGPVIAQQRPPDFIESPEFNAKWRIETNNYNGNWNEDPDSFIGDWKIYPDKDDISVIGRKNTDLILRGKINYDEVILRAGKIDYKDILSNAGNQGRSNILGGGFKLNKVNPAYITVNYTTPQTYETNTNNNVSNAAFKDTVNQLNLEDDRSHINLVADKINLISHMGSSIKGQILGGESGVLSGDNILGQIKTENEDLHPLVYGDVLWEFMNKMKAFVEGHIHPYHGLPPDPSLVTTDLIKWFNDNMGKVVDAKNPDNTTYKDFEGCTFLSRGIKTN